MINPEEPLENQLKKIEEKCTKALNAIKKSNFDDRASSKNNFELLFKSFTQLK
jgi:hypothetical protein